MQIQAAMRKQGKNLMDHLIGKNAVLRTLTLAMSEKNGAVIRTDGLTQEVCRMSGLGRGIIRAAI